MSFQFNRHTAAYFGTDKLSIGCHTYTLVEWLKNYKEVGQKEKYTDVEISHYGRFIKGCIRAYNLTKENK